MNIEVGEAFIRLVKFLGYLFKIFFLFNFGNNAPDGENAEKEQK